MQEENMNTEKEIKEKNCGCSKLEKWIKFFTICLAVLIGAFLAFYFIIDQAIKQIFWYPVKDIKKMEKLIDSNNKMLEIPDKMMEDSLKLPSFSPFVRLMQSDSLPAAKFFQNEDQYKIIVNLKNFDWDESDIKLDIKPNKIAISGSIEKDKDNEESSKSFSQIFTFNKKIDTKSVTKEKQGDNYIITLPFEKK